MIKIIKYITLASLLLLISEAVFAQFTVKGVIFRADTRLPLSNARIASPSASFSAVSDEEGAFELILSNLETKLIVSATSFFEQEIYLAGRSQVNIYLLPETDFMTVDTWTSIEGEKKINQNIGASISIDKKDIGAVYSSPDDALTGKIAGLKVLNKSGMPGEGSMLTMRGLQSMIAENMPLLVVDGMPYLPDYEESYVINGFSRNVFMPTNMKEISSMTLLKGADAAPFGSLASNGVLMINTEKASDLETKIQVHTLNGVSFLKKRIPVMKAEAFKTYIADIGETRYTDLNELINIFPFLKDDPTNYYAYLYENDTDWQDKIYTPAYFTENILKITGGDAVASYALSAGFLNNKGIIENTKHSKYYTRLNADINVTRKLKFFTTASFNYSDIDLMEQGISAETNPILASIYQSPLLSVYEQDRFKNNLPNYNPVHSVFGVSNPASIVNGVEANSKSYDILVNIGLNYTINPYLNISAIGGLYYNYVKEDLFIPGKSSTHAIAPLMSGLAENSVRSGTGEGLNYYLRGTFSFDNTYSDIHNISASLGYQLISSRREFDCGSGINTTSDFYNTLTNINTSYGRTVVGYINEWNWMNAYLTAKYDFRNQYYVTGNLVVDASSSYGSSTGRVFVFPSAQIGWNLKNSSFLRNNDFVSNLTIRAEYGVNGNSRFSSKYGRYYYESVPFRDIAGMTRAGMPNNKIKPEKIHTTNVGLDFTLVGNRLRFILDLYEEYTKDMLLQKDIASVYGFSYMYDNAGKIRTRGIELNLSANIISTNNWYWNVGGNISTFTSEVRSLGGLEEKIVTFSDGTKLISKVGKAPNQFYGYEAEKIFYTRREAETADYTSHSGLKFSGGDVKFRDVNGDKIIDDEDMTILGNPMPDFYGGFHSELRYKGFGLYMNFTYSYGNKIYNAVRRGAESMENFYNQSKAVEKRWIKDGDITNLPRAVYGDQIGNRRFSSRWIEDGSYLKLKEITFSYETSKKVLFFNQIKAYVTMENLFTVTKYLGIDPEFSYSYDPLTLGMDLGKVPLPKTAKVGLILNF